MKLARISKTAAAVAALLSSAQIAAQRTDDSAVESADDAFGKSVGDEQIGMYNPGLVRGFSPEAAGNLRIEGLYFDQRAFVTQRLINGATVRVGISAQGYPFPAPTGIADYSLRKPGDQFIASAALNYGPFGGRSAELDVQIPIDGDRLGATLGIAFYEDGTTFGSTPEYDTYGASLRFRPSDNFSVQAFGGHIDFRDEDAQPLIFPDGPFLPKKYDRSQYFGQEWAESEGNRQTFGIVSKARIAQFEVAAGAFHSQTDLEKSHADLLFDTNAQGNVGRRVIVADRNNFNRSTSGELRISRAFVERNRRHTIITSIRGRSLNRAYGGSALIDLDRSVTGEEDFRPEPASNFGTKTKDAVEQVNIGLGYELRWQNVGELSAGLQKVDYSKLVTTPAGPLPETIAKPWLYSINAAAHMTSKLALYGGYTRGLEESDVAPANATNRNEAPPAIRTEQKDFGVRWTVSPTVSMVMGYFNVRKPYFNLDPLSRFRQLGNVTHQGVEASVSGQVAPGLRIVAGTVFLDAKIDREQVGQGLIGNRPVGGFRLHTIVNANWMFPWHKNLTLTGRIERTSSRPANVQNTLFIPPRAIVSVGARYRANIGKIPVLIRFNADNIFNNFGWAVGGSGFFLNNGARRFSLTVAADL